MKDYRNILVYSFMNIGDVLLSTAAAALLKYCYPQAKITMMVKAPALGLITNNPVIDEAISYDCKEKKWSLKDHLHFIKKLRESKFDLSISLDRKLRPALCTWLAGISTRVGPDRLFNDDTIWLTKLYTYIIKMPIDINNRLQVENYQEIVRRFTGVERTCRPVMPIPNEAEQANARRLIEGLPQARYRIALCIKGTFPLKDWPKERFASVIDKLAARYEAAFFIIGALGDRQEADRVISMAQAPVTNFCGLTNLIELGAVLKFANLFITVDTGAAHIGAAIDIPMVSIFGCTSPIQWSPQGKSVTVLSKKLKCCPCTYSPEGCPNDKACLLDISVDDVVSAAVAQLEKGC